MKRANIFTRPQRGSFQGFRKQTLFNIGNREEAAPESVRPQRLCFAFSLLVFVLQDTARFIAYPGKGDSYFSRGLLTSQRCEGKVGLFIEALKSALTQVFQRGA